MGSILGGKPDNSAATAAAEAQAAALQKQAQQSRETANETARQSAAQISQQQQRDAVQANIDAANQANKPVETSVDLSQTSVEDTTTRKRSRFNTASDPSDSIRI